MIFRTPSGPRISEGPKPVLSAITPHGKYVMLVAKGIEGEDRATPVFHHGSLTSGTLGTTGRERRREAEDEVEEREGGSGLLPLLLMA